MIARPASPFTALSDLLREMACAVSQLAPEEYTDSEVPGISGSIGGHVRHSLDHVRALEAGLEHGRVDYDTRHRQTAIEHDRETAVLALMAAAARFHALDTAVLSRTVTVRSLLARDGRSVEGASSIARELAFVVSHTIHHNAQIALLAHRIGSGRLPSRFGVAPSTPVLAGAA